MAGDLIHIDAVHQRADTRAQVDADRVSHPVRDCDMDVIEPVGEMVGHPGRRSVLVPTVVLRVDERRS